MSGPVARASVPAGRFPPEEEVPGHRSELFMVRLWPEEIDGGQVEWRGKVRHVTSGAFGYFRDWSTLVALLQEMLPETGG